MIFNSNKIFFYRNNEIVRKFPYSKAKKDIKNILNYVRDNESDKKKLSMSIHFIDSEKMKELNNEHRNKNSSTDVLSFPHNEYDKNFFYIGDIFINENIIEEQSKEIDSDPLTEVKFLSMHGILHLVGYVHTKKQDEIIMIKKQKEIFSTLRIRND